MQHGRMSPSYTSDLMKHSMFLFVAVVLAACSPSQPSTTTAAPPAHGSTSSAFEGIGHSGSTGPAAGDSGGENDGPSGSSSGAPAAVEPAPPMISSSAPCVRPFECTKGLTSMVKLPPSVYGCTLAQPCKRTSAAGECFCFYTPE